MKKIVVFAAFFAFVLAANAQEESLRFGFQLSPTFSWMNTNTNKINSSGTNLGLKMAMIGEYYFAENYALTSGIGFAFNQGGTLQYELPGCYWRNSNLDLPASFRSETFNCDSLPAGVKLKYQLQYLEIPIGLKMRTREFGYVRYYLEPALTLGINTQATGDVKGRGIGNDVEKVDISGDANALNLAWGVGGGVEYSISENTSFVGGLAFQIGFADVSDDGAVVFDERAENGTRRENSKAKNNNIIIRLAVMF
jgi:hypothetical protein